MLQRRRLAGMELQCSFRSAIFWGEREKKKTSIFVEKNVYIEAVKVEKEQR